MHSLSSRGAGSRRQVAALLRRGLAGVSRAAAYSLSMGLLAVAALVAIPAMIRADGTAAWGAIAVGQSIGAVAAVVISFGWGISGPVRIARGDAFHRRREYLESLVTRLFLVLPAAGLAAAAAALIAPGHQVLAALGAVTASSIGLTGAWYFVGLARPLALLAWETLPRVCGTAVGIGFMAAGHSAAVGLSCQLVGMLAACGCVTRWVLVTTRRDGAAQAPRRPTRRVLAEQGQGVVSVVGSSVYVASPVIIVSLLAPGVLPVYALADKLQRQVSVALNPGVTVLQGWVPRAQGRSMHLQRARISLSGALIGCTALTLFIWLGAPWLIALLGDGRIDVSPVATALMAAFVGLNLLESIVAKVLLASFDRLDVVARATTVSMVVGLPLVALGALQWGAEGALAGVVAGLLVRLAPELRAAARHISRPHQDVVSVVDHTPETAAGQSADGVGGKAPDRAEDQTSSPAVAGSADHPIDVAGHPK